jgi:hypothetical protein
MIQKADNPPDDEPKPEVVADPPKNKGGRPEKTIDLEEVRRLAAIMCTQMEIAAVLGVDVSTLKRREGFALVYKDGQDEGKMSLRRAMFKSALGGSYVMQIWLSKQHLGMKDKNELDINDQRQSAASLIGGAVGGRFRSAEEQNAEVLPNGDTG